jgi:hypothetical protein
MFGKKPQTTLVRVYKSAREIQKDANKLARDGWRVPAQTEMAAGRSLLAIGLTHRITVTYLRDPDHT